LTWPRRALYGTGVGEPHRSININLLKSMRLPKLLGFALSLVLAGSALAADHWYQITITDGGSTVEFTGSSASDSGQISKMLAGTDPVVLDNLREFSPISEEENAPSAWHPVAGATKLFLVPKHILFFYELAGDPLSEQPAAAPAEPAPAAAAPAPASSPVKESAPAKKKK
jgi:hypothetical protein